MKIQDLLEITFLSKLSTNNEESHYAYLKSNANLEKNNYQHELYISNGEITRKALSLKEFSNYFWETNYTLLIPYSEKSIIDKTTQLYRYDIKKKSFEKAHTLNVPISNIQVINEQLWVLTTSLSENEHNLYEDPANRQDYLSDHSDYEEITSIPFYRDGGSFTRNQLTQILLYNPEEKTYERIFEKDIDVAMCQHNPYTNKLYILAQKDTQVASLFNDVYVYDLTKHELTTLYTKKEISIRNFIGINDEYFLFGSDLKDHGINQNNKIYKLHEGNIELIIDFGRSSYNSTGSDVRLLPSQSAHLFKDKYMFVGTYQDRTILYTFDGKKLHETYQPQGSIDGWINFKDMWIGIGLFDNKAQELYQFNIVNQTYTQITQYNESILTNKYISKPIYHSFTDSDRNLDGWVLLPQDYDENKSYPAILEIHGGPKTIYNENLFHEMQVFVNEGYIVFFCNPRGGDAYDDDFADIRGQYGSIDYEDIMWFTDFVIENYAIDENRIGVTGGSYGGFMTNWIVSHTDRFKAAVTQRSISNWISFYGTSDIGYYFGPDQTDADPIDDFEKAWNQSPLKYAKNINTPLLFIHSDQDYRCPIEQALQLYTVIKKNGVDTKLIWFKNENHNLSRGGRPKSRIKRLTEMVEWMNDYLKEN